LVKIVGSDLKQITMALECFFQEAAHCLLKRPYQEFFMTVPLLKLKIACRHNPVPLRSCPLAGECENHTWTFVAGMLLSPPIRIGIASDPSAAFRRNSA
jgi:hypothetical protein